MSNLMISRWCEICHVNIYPGVNPPPSHLRHSGVGSGMDSVGVHCNICNLTFYSNMKLPDNHPHSRHMLSDKQMIKQASQAAQLKAEQEGQGMKIVNKGNYIKIGGVLPNEDYVVHEKMARALADKKRRNEK